MIVGIISEDRTDCLAIEQFISRISNGSHTFVHAHGTGKDAIIHQKKRFASKLKNFNCEFVVIVRDSDGGSVSERVADIEAAYDSTQISDLYKICIAVEEVEAWVLGDIDTVISYYSLPKNAARSFASRPDEITSPKDVLKEYVSKQSKQLSRYLTSDAARLAEIINITKIQSCSPSFVHFSETILSNVS